MKPEIILSEVIQERDKYRMIYHMWEIKKNSKEINGKWKQTLRMQKTEFTMKEK